MIIDMNEILSGDNYIKIYPLIFLLTKKKKVNERLLYLILESRNGEKNMEPVRDRCEVRTTMPSDHRSPFQSICFSSHLSDHVDGYDPIKSLILLLEENAKIKQEFYVKIVLKPCVINLSLATKCIYIYN